MHRSKPDARTYHDALSVVNGQRPIEALAGPVRLAPYLTNAGGDEAKAAELYLWAGDLAGALHSTIAFVEVAVRNSLDAQLAEWNAEQVGEPGRNWALRDCSTPTLECDMNRRSHLFTLLSDHHNTRDVVEFCHRHELGGVTGLSLSKRELLMRVRCCND